MLAPLILYALAPGARALSRSPPSSPTPHTRTLSVQHFMAGTGVTSVLFADGPLFNDEKNDDDRGERATLVVGTKRGAVVPISLSRRSGGKTTPWRLHERSALTDTTRSRKPYPIYSMAWYDIKENPALDDSGNDAMRASKMRGDVGLACGGGDRYLTLWEWGGRASVDGETATSVHVRDMLGMHTGWVKDVVWDGRNGFLHSIGCNCIETWTNTDGVRDSAGTTSRSWRHVSKRAIDSCPQYGSTLSSDLLCLCLDKSFNRLYSGGVDGRIHVWSGSDVALGTPLHSIPAHDGRVNALALGNKSGLLFSAGHDGSVQCRDMSKRRDSSDSEDDPPAEISLCDVLGSPARVTSIACVGDDHEGETTVVVGTSCGILGLFTAAKEAKNGSSAIKLVEKELLQIEHNPAVHGLSVTDPDLSTCNDCTIAIAHSNGLSLLVLS